MPGTRPTIGDVARAAGVSKGTVSLAYSGKRPVAEETRRRIFTAAESLRWTASSSAQALATSRTSTIGLVIARRPEIIATDTFFPRFIAGCEAVLAEAGIGLMLNVVTDQEAETAAYERYAAGRVDGVILLDVERDDRRPDLVRELGLTAVLLGAEAPPAGAPEDVPVVYTEDAAAVEGLIEELVDAGHTSIAHVSGPLQYLHAAARRDAFVTAIARHGLVPDHVVEGDFTAASGRDATAALLEHSPRPTAIVFANDVMAIAGLSFARSAGLRIPEDLSLTGFDDSELSAHLSPGLTSVSTGADVRGAVAARTLLAALAGEADASVKVDGTTVVRRGSVAPPAST
ncbi:hypothetical protein BH708_03180 [Brachybacterium sp. P6-10-X1]|uniref:LacI family DNA-binding transcriptional regulator n=1 Tax=Brachybacterium sp. P6-10-X1 TaxID=1903186 RepID=UPI0009717E94|nr:LacI family DNA-binding transcriptional regulator [Brachybacterium sp. P6-10-X1]APX31889.1 hypothetical protein BH708_03180 [Brachybacterium sp. P6-10-X1]